LKVIGISYSSVGCGRTVKVFSNDFYFVDNLNNSPTLTLNNQSKPSYDYFLKAGIDPKLKPPVNDYSVFTIPLSIIYKFYLEIPNSSHLLVSSKALTVKEIAYDTDY